MFGDISSMGPIYGSKQSKTDRNCKPQQKDLICVSRSLRNSWFYRLESLKISDRHLSCGNIVRRRIIYSMSARIDYLVESDHLLHQAYLLGEKVGSGCFGTLYRSI